MWVRTHAIDQLARMKSWFHAKHTMQLQFTNGQLSRSIFRSRRVRDKLLKQQINVSFAKYTNNIHETDATKFSLKKHEEKNIISTIIKKKLNKNKILFFG